MPELYVFHPSKNLVPAVDSLLENRDSSFRYTNIIKPELLNDAIKNGITDSVISEVKNAVNMMPADDKNLMLCTCSTLGGIAEDIGKDIGRRVIRIDRPMAEKAIATGIKIGIAAALESTMQPTQSLLQSVAERAEKEVEFVQMHIGSAWERKMAGDDEGYINEIVDYLEKNHSGFDVIVLAQGSMSPAKDRISFSNPAVLTSTNIGVEGALEIL